MERVPTYVIGGPLAAPRPVVSNQAGVDVSALADIVDRAIIYTNAVLDRMPSYRQTAIAGLRKLRAALAERTPDDPALARLDAYLESLDGGPAPDESTLTRS